jgi:predicted nuclease with TOPRIM domain
MKLGSIIDRLYELRTEKSELNSKVQVIETEITELKTLLMSRLDDEETIKACGKNASVTITSQTVPNVTDWDLVHQYVVENDACYLLEKRLSAAPYRELLMAGTPIPGTEPFEKRDISLRKL